MTPSDGINIEVEGLNPSYIGSRDDVLTLVPPTIKRVLDIGCSIGTLGEQIKRKYGAEVSGIELDERMAKIAKTKLDEVIIGDVETIDLENLFPPKYFDCIIFADVLEHLKDPWKVLKKATKLLSDEGVVIASIPNIRHYHVIVNLVFRGYWPYRERGIHDKTHLRFFTLKNIFELFQHTGLKIIKIKRNYRIIESPHSLNRFAKYFAFPLLKEFITFQYLVEAKKQKK